MKNHILKYFTIALLSICLNSIMYKSTCAAPKIKFEQTSFDFGNVVQGKSITHIYKFKNTGDVPLTINKVRAG